jgi:hypothetical protein
MNRKVLINRLVARKLKLAGNAQASNVKICHNGPPSTYLLGSCR